MNKITKTKNKKKKRQKAFIKKKKRQNNNKPVGPVHKRKLELNVSD